MKKHILIVILVLLVSASCTKVTDTPLRTSLPLTDTVGSLTKALDNSPCHLFDSAFHKVDMDTALKLNAEYTILAPTDSAMMAAGYTAQVIGSLSVDSLFTLVRYHITYGGYSDASLTSALSNVQAPTLLQRYTTDSILGDFDYQQNVYLKENTVLYANGESVGTGTPSILATNGYLLTINKVLNPPTQTVWSIITSDPRLDMYVAALRIDDSIFLAYQINNFYEIPPLLYDDSILFNSLNYTNENPNSIQPNLLTVFAPTDSAFYAAGFQTVQDIRNYALSQPIQGVYNALGQYIVADIPMDSILYAHVAYNQYNQDPISIDILYNDFLYSPLINQGFPNTDTYQMLYRYLYMEYFQPNPLYYSVQNGVPFVQWNTSLPGAALLPNTNPTRPNHTVATNGVVYVVNKLFTSPN